MKRLCIAIALLAGMIWGCFLSYQTLDRTTAELAGQVAKTDALLSSGAWEEAYAALQESYYSWERRQPLLGALVRHNELDDIENLFLRAMQAMDNADENEYRLQSRELQGMLLHLPEMEQPVTQNIF